MRKFIASFILFFCFAISAYTQMAIGDWRAHLAYNNASMSAPAGNLIYVLSDAALYSYDIEDTSIRQYDKINLLNDNSISYIAYSNVHKILIIAYTNSNIDLLINENNSYNIPDLMNKTMPYDKKINNIYTNQDNAYLATNFGVVILNLKKKEISNSYILNKTVYNSIIQNDTLFIATDKGIYMGALKDNLSDNNNWKLFNKTVADNIFLLDNKIIINENGKGIYQYNPESEEFTQLINGYYSYINIYDTKLVAGNNNTIIVYEQNKFTHLETDEYFNHISYNKTGNTYWGSQGINGVNGYKLNTETKKLEKIIEKIKPNSPRRNLEYYMTFATNNNLLIAGGNLNYDGKFFPGSFMMMSNSEEWLTFDEDMKSKTGVDYTNVTSVIQDPRDPEHHFAATAGQGLYEFKNKKFFKLHDSDNSTLQAISGMDKKTYVRIGGLQYDKNNNLWMVNSRVPYIIQVLKADGTWMHFNHPDIATYPTFDLIMFDKRGWAWVTSRRKEPGLFCLDTNGTLEETNDDRSKFRTSLKNQDGEDLKNNIYSIAEDKNGAIWIGTEKGPLVMNNPTKYFDDNFYCTKIKVPRNDGTQLADFLLENERINAICIDGANRKWIGTQSSGVYLLSEDGLESIHHFNVENSPLLSNCIQSIAIHPKTGEVFIGTDVGLISYKSDATEAGNSFSEDAHAYPNPVHSDYDGVITVTGLVKDSDVKITDVNGNLIYAGTSVGGQFTWNGKNKNGKRVASGVYFVLAANAEGKEGIATKIVMIK